MAIDRRIFLAQLGALALVPAAPAASAAPFLAARGNAGGGFCVSRFDASGRIDYDVEFPGRGHGFAVSSDGGWPLPSPAGRAGSCWYSTPLGASYGRR